MRLGAIGHVFSINNLPRDRGRFVSYILTVNHAGAKGESYPQKYRNKSATVVIIS